MIKAQNNNISKYTPSSKINKFYYNCGNDYTEYVEQNNDLVVIIVVDNREGAVSIINGDNIEYINETHSGVGGKHSKGGQSQRRYERNRNRELNDYYKRIADKGDVLVNYNPVKLIMAGPAQVKHLVYRLLDYRLRELPVQFMDIEYSGHSGVYQTMSRIKDV